MKKITEAQLKNRVNGLREYIAILSEEGVGNDTPSVIQDLQKAKAAAAPAAGAPADNRNIFQKGVDAVSDFHKKNTERFYAKQAADAVANSPEGMAAAKAKLTPSQLAWLGNAQPSPEILQRVPEPTAKEKADAAAAAPRGPGLKPPKYGPFGTETRPLDGSDDRRVNGQGLKMPAQAPAAAGERPGGVAFNQDKAAQDSRIADRMDAEANASGAGQRPGEHATKVARFKELIAKAKELRTDTEVQASKDLGSFAGESTTYFLNKLRLIESRQLNEELSPEEQAEMDDLAIELGQQGAENDTELVAAINDYNSLPKSAPAAVPAFNAAKDSQRSNVTAISTELRAIAADVQKLGPNATPDDIQPLVNRLTKVQTDAAGAGEDIKSAVQALAPDIQANLKKVSDLLAAGPNAAKNPLAGVKWAYAVGDGTVAGSAKMAADAAAAAKYGSAFTGVGNPGEQAAADKAAQANQAAAVRPPVAVDPRDGAVGQALAKLGVSKKDRLDQAFVDSTLGAGKYKAGSADSNMALQAHFKKQGSGSGAPASTPRPAASAPASAPAAPTPAPAAPTPAPGAGAGRGGQGGPTAQQFTSDWNNKMKAAQKLGWPDSTKLPPADWAPMGTPKVAGKNKLAPDLKEAVTYADDQTLARIVSLSRR